MHYTIVYSALKKAYVANVQKPLFSSYHIEMLGVTKYAVVIEIISQTIDSLTREHCNRNPGNEWHVLECIFLISILLASIF